MICSSAGFTIGQYVPATGLESNYGNLVPSTCSLNDVGTDTRDGNTGLGYAYGSPHYGNFLNVTVNSCMAVFGAPGFYWESSHGTDGNSPLPSDAQDPDVVLVSPGADAPPANIDDVWAIAVYYSASNGGYCMSIAQFLPGDWIFTPMSAPILIQPFSPSLQEPHINIDSDNFGRYAVVMQLDSGILSKTQTLLTMPTVPVNPAFQAGLIEPDIACMHNSAYLSKIVALNENRDQYYAYTRNYPGAVWPPYISPVMSEMQQPRIAAPSSGVADEYAVTVARKYAIGPNVMSDILFQIDEGTITRANAGDPGYPGAINLNNGNVLPCLTYSYFWAMGSLQEQVSLGWYVEEVPGVFPDPTQNHTFIGLDIDPVFPYAPSTPAAYMDISSAPAENNESAMAISGRYTHWAKSAAFTYQTSFPGFGNKLVWKITNSPATNWKSGESQLEDVDVQKAEVTVYPNPASDQVQLYIADFDGPCRYEVLNQVGQMVSAGQIEAPTSSIALDQLPAGMYFIKVKGQKTASTSLHKLVKE